MVRGVAILDRKGSVMRHVLLPATAAAFLTCSLAAKAADLPAYRGPPPPPAFSWT